MTTLKKSGSVIDAVTRKNIADLRAEAWGRVAGAEKQLGVTTTDTEGHFLIEFNLPDQQLSRQPLGVIKIFSGDILLHTTAEEPIAEWTPQQPDLVIELNPPAAPDSSVQLFITASLANGNPAAGVQLVVSYELPDADTWTSQPITANDNGKFTVAIPVDSPDSMDWHRVGFAFSKDSKPLRVIGKTQPDSVEGGFAVVVELAQDSIPSPPEQDPNKWYVRGRVTSRYGDAVMANVSAASISLDGANPLGQAQTSDSGRYEIVYGWDGQCAPDVQVSARFEDELIAQSAIYFTVGKSIRIDLVTGNAAYVGPTEFQRVEEKILKCNGEFNIADIGEQQFEYLLGKTRLPQDTLNVYLVARTLASRSDVPTAVFYGLFRSSLPASLQGLVMQDNKVVQDALTSAINRNIIDRKNRDYLDPLFAALQQMAVEGSLNSIQQLDHTGVGDLLILVKVPKDVHEQLVNLYFEHDGDDASYWESLHNSEQLGKHAGKVKLGLQSGALAWYHPPTIEKLTATLGGDADVKQLAYWGESDWQAFAQSLDSVPDNIAGDSPAERIGNFVDGMRRTIKRAFATEYTTANVLRSEHVGWGECNEPQHFAVGGNALGYYTG